MRVFNQTAGEEAEGGGRMISNRETVGSFTQNRDGRERRQQQKRKLDEEVVSYLPDDSVPLQPPPHTLLPWRPAQTEVERRTF